MIVNLGATTVNLGATTVNLGATTVNLGATTVNLGATTVNLGAYLPEGCVCCVCRMDDGKWRWFKHGAPCMPAAHAIMVSICTHLGRLWGRRPKHTKTCRGGLSQCCQP
jgi:hypothetical protein